MKKFFLSIILFSLIMSINTRINAESANIFDETESNNMFSFSNELVVTTGRTLISGSMQHNSTTDTIKDTEDWFKITFENNGKCDFKFINLTELDKSNSYLSEHFDLFDEKLNRIKVFDKGLAHDADETFYIRLSSSTYGDKNKGYSFEYQLMLNDSDDYDYVSDKYCKPSNAYELDEGFESKFLGLGTTNTKYFTIDVPKGKYVDIIIKPSSESDKSILELKPFEVTIFKDSIENKVIDAYKLSDVMVFDCCIKDDVVKNYFKGSSTYIVAINGGEYFDEQANQQWGSITYILRDKPNDVTPPTVKGVKNGRTYSKSVTIKYSDASGIKSAKLNNKSIKSGYKVTKKGKYKLIITDKSGNKKIVKFKISK